MPITPREDQKATILPGVGRYNGTRQAYGPHRDGGTGG
jgi:hypothetical protein